MCAAESAALPSDPALASATELLALYRARALSPVEATKSALARIERHNGTVNAWCHLDPDGALAAARASEARWQAGAPAGLIDGVPVGIKDNILVAGDNSCLAHIGGILGRQRSGVRRMHLAEILASTEEDPA